MRALRNPFGSLPPEVAVLTAVAFSVALGFGILAPAIPLFAKDFGVSNFAAGAVISVFALVRFASAPGAGRFVNRFGERLVLATGIGIVGVSSLLAGFSSNYAQLLVLRGIGGFGSAMFTVSSFALLLRVVAPDQRGRAAGTYQTGFLLGAIAGPAFGGPLTAWSLRAPFFVYATTLLVAGSLATVFLARTALREHEVVAGTADHPPTPLGTAMRSSAYRAAVANNFAVGWAIFGVRSSLIPLFVVEGLASAPRGPARDWCSRPRCRGSSWSRQVGWLTPAGAARSCAPAQPSRWWPGSPWHSRAGPLSSLPEWLCTALARRCSGCPRPQSWATSSAGEAARRSRPSRWLPTPAPFSDRSSPEHLPTRRHSRWRSWRRRRSPGSRSWPPW